MLRFLIYLILGYIIWKIVRIVTSSGRGGGRAGRQGRGQPPEFPQDSSYKHIEDADFEDISSDPEKPS
ncbi:MAG TPA: hypothetical protein VJO14_04930 [Bacteroidota bacterium]|nr:hypothetical protein [Bacteroidota bacterium]